jgi:uncharacterized damage-inducible protein DinB
VDILLERTTHGPTVPPLTEILQGRDAVRSATTRLLAVDDGDLPRRWLWRGEATGWAELRYGFYRCAELFDAAGRRIATALDDAGTVRTAGSRLLAQATAARWELHGVLTWLSDSDLDRPAGAEWTVRQTLAHIVNVQRAYGSFTAWWHSRAADADFPAEVPDDVGEGFPEEEADGAGSLDEIRGRLDAVVDTAAGRLGGFDEDDLAVRARWAGYEVDVGFRLGRMASHLREHTVQIDKTLALLGVEPREVDRLVRLVHDAFGRMEAAAFGLDPAAAAPAAPLISATVTEVATIVASLEPAAD